MALTAWDALEMATVNGGKALGRKTGRIEKGYDADLILLEQKWPESVENQGLEGPQPVGKDEVGSSNLPSSSKKTT